MAKLIGFEIRRYATILVEDEVDIPTLIESAIREEDPRLDWNEPEIDYIETLRDYEEESAIYDIAFEEQREAQFG